MGRLVEKIIKNPNIPILSDVGLSMLIDELFNSNLNYKTRALKLLNDKPFEDEAPISKKQLEDIEKLIFYRVIFKISEGIRKNPSYVEELKSKKNFYKNFNITDFQNLVSSRR